MNPIRKLCVRALLRLLNPGEREAVQGDLEESGVSAGGACRELLGLAARRQIALWRSWQPWVVVSAVIYLLVPLLGQCLDADRQTLLALHRIPRGGEMSFRCILVCGACLTFLWSWASGFALGALSPRTVWITGPAFCLAGLRGVPYGIFGPTGMYRQWSGGPTDVLLAVLLQTALFWLPSIYGLCAGLKRDRAPLGAGLLPLALTAVAVGVVAWAGSWTWETAFDRLSAYAVLSWPLVYRVARGVRVSAKLPESPA